MGDTVGNRNWAIEEATSKAPEVALSKTTPATVFGTGQSAVLRGAPDYLASNYTHSQNLGQLRLSEPLLDQALQIFLSDTVIQCADDSNVRGHFTRLAAAARVPTACTSLKPALEAVALASMGMRFHVPEAHLLAAHRYNLSLCRLRGIDLRDYSKTADVIACILLLSLYEIINSSEDTNLNWMRHVDGMIAVIRNRVENDHLSISGITGLVTGIDTASDIYSSSTNVQRSNNSTVVLCLDTNPPVDDLSLLLSRVQKLFKKAATVFQPCSILYDTALKQYRDEAIALQTGLYEWAATHAECKDYRTIHYFTRPYALRFPGIEDLICEVTRADAYHDYFTACMWTSYRQCQLHLTNLLIRISYLCASDPDAYIASREYTKLYTNAMALVSDTNASIPYLLAGDDVRWSGPNGSIWYQSRPPPLIGGLSLQWVLFTISILECLPLTTRRNAKESLLWIGKNLGIGQATVLARMDRNPPGGVTAKGDILRWIGFLL